MRDIDLQATRTPLRMPGIYTSILGSYLSYLYWMGGASEGCIFNYGSGVDVVPTNIIKRLEGGTVG